jgi:hypothetical protein
MLISSKVSSCGPCSTHLLPRLFFFTTGPSTLFLFFLFHHPFFDSVWICSLLDCQSFNLLIDSLDQFSDDFMITRDQLPIDKREEF